MRHFLIESRVWLERKLFLIGLFLFLPLLSGCLPVTNTYKSPMAVRFVNYHNTNYVSEKLIEADTEFGLEAAVSPEGPGTAHISQKQSFYLETAHVMGFGAYWVGTNGYYRVGHKMTKIENLPNPKNMIEVSDWNFWPVPETNLWVATDCSSNVALRSKNESPWDKDVYLKVFLFDSEKVIRQKQLTVFTPEHHNNGYPDFRFDALYQRITYKTHNGYETYSLGKDTIIPCETPSGEPALPIKNHGEGFDSPFLIFYHGRYYLSPDKHDD